MKKCILIVLTTAFVLFGFGSCTGILDTAPYDKLASSSMWITEESVDQGISGVYSALYDWAPYSGSFASNNGSTWCFEPWGMSGELRYGEALTNGSINPSNGNFSNIWKKLYEGVHRANDAIANIAAKSPASAAKNARLIAEAKFLRAYFYFRLNELYGRDGLGVPLYLEPVEVEDCNKGQSQEDEVWAQIISDLTDAINEPNLPNRDNTGRVSKGAAYALRGKAYLYQGAKYGNSGAVSKNDDLLNKAVADFDKVSECGYSLFQGGYKELFLEENEHSIEMIFSIQHNSETGHGTLSQKYCGSRFAYALKGGNGWGDLSVSPYVVALYEVNDGTPFNWDDVFPGYNALPPADRAVYFLRDTLGADGEIIKQTGDQAPLVQTARTKVATLLEAASAEARALYLPYGNEARIRQAYSNRDPRLAANVITPYSSIEGGYSYNGAGNAMVVVWRWPVIGGNQTPDKTKNDDMAVDNANHFSYYHRKFVYEGASLGDRDNGPTDEPLIRYASVLLWQAEAYVELGQLDKAKANVKQVRNRVDMPTLDSNFADQTKARDYVRDERRREFVNEGVNFFDEMHWRTLKATKFKGGDNGQSETVWGATGNAGSYKWAGDHLYVWPVPQTEIEKNPNLTKTPGWQY
jgi:hypothetical protein